ncbi:hypothetical protein [Botrimarina hoheduenensis]|uniref:hypothetical protein n=1 Tax=Botrimarina hoheduenensis TaxID=2528000 RepID=UPI0011B4820E|nr:hypothetical protein [Botrimarina hoheduenensis]
MLATLVATAQVGAQVGAQPPDRLDSYRIVPRKSELRQTGGFAGVDQRFRVQGTYDFVGEWINDPPTTLRHQARFDNADLMAPLGPMLPAFIDVDDLFNLDNLTGELLPLGAPFDVYRFRGLANTSSATSPLEQSSVELYAALLGPWMYVYGQTTQPPWVADGFEYELRLLARTGRSADTNEDGVVDAADYTLIFDAAAVGNALLPSLADWSAQYGEVVPDMDVMDAQLGAALATGLAVPEPAALAVAMFALVVSGPWRTSQTAGA